MPGSTALYQTDQDEDEIKDLEPHLNLNRQPPPVAPKTTRITLQSWQSSTHDSYGDNKHARSASMDSLESSGSSSSGGGSGLSNNRVCEQAIGEYIPTRSAGKAQKLPPHNPLQFVKVQSPLYKKAEQQLKLTKEVKISREALKEGEEEWQSNLDNWKSRRRKVTEKVIQRAEEIRQIEAEEQQRQEQCLLQNKKIKKFSEIVERRSSRTYNLDLYIGQGDDSGLGGTPEPDDVIDGPSSIIRSDTSEGMTSEAESIDSDTQKSDKVQVSSRKKPQLWFQRSVHVDSDQSPTNSILSEVASKELHSFDIVSSTEPSDIEGQACDSETISSEDDVCFGDCNKLESDLENIDNCLVDNKSPSEQSLNRDLENNQEYLTSDSKAKVDYKSKESVPNTVPKECGQIHCFKISIKPGDSKGFGFCVKGGKDVCCKPYIENITLDGPASMIGLKESDEIVSLNGELVCTCSHASLIFIIKQAVYMGTLDIEIFRYFKTEIKKAEMITKTATKKSSFAEKLALFSSTERPSLEKNKSVESFTKPDQKKESLVLRRRSAFENGSAEHAFRRSSCLLEEASKTHVPEKRLSADLSSQLHQKKIGQVKKDPPPPVPAKPKLKQLLKSESINTYECDNFNQNSHATNTVLNNSFDSETKSIETMNSLRLDKVDMGENSDNLHNISLEKKETKQIRKLHKTCSIESEIDAEDIAVVNISGQENKIITELQQNNENMESSPDDCDFINNDSETEIPENFCIIEEETIPDSDINLFENNIISEAEENLPNICSNSIEVSFRNIYNIETEKHTSLDTKQNEEDFAVPDLSNNYSYTVIENVKDNLENFHISAYNEVSNINNENSVNSLDLAQKDTAIENENICDYNVSKLDSPDVEDLLSVENSSENVTATPINPSPLCLSLEKTDEDDVISASTTTSSETPDTETVIETLPTNLSPLPNDESNGEDSSKPSDLPDQQTEFLNGEEQDVAESENYFSTDERTNINSECVEYLKSDQEVVNEQKFSSDINNFAVTNDDVFIDEQDEEYRMELDESLDQITSLDVIDEIEHRLMQQLENQDNSFEELEENLTLQLENDMNQDWMYYSEADLLEDYTPRNREPPQEPPPPPPIEELEVIEEKEVLPLARANSTKRIKKELWRRRSDFLGLNSSEGIDIDSILPPPPGLEEILKFEREQNQWLEKRLSLVESEIQESLAATSTDLNSEDINKSDYSSSYLLSTEDEPELKFDDPSKNWQTNLEEDDSCEPNYEFLPSEQSSNFPEESVKIKESPQHKAKQNIFNLGAAPKAKIMDSNKWITEKVAPVSRKSTEPIFRQASYDQNFWIAQDTGRKRSLQSDIPDRRYSMISHSSNHPDVTLRTWDDRENEYQRQRPRSAVWNSASNAESLYDTSTCLKQDILSAQTLDDDEIRCDTDILESEVHQCSCCGKGLCEGSAMGIEALRLFFHIECFRCCVCQMLLGNGMCGTDVQVKNNQLYCPNCFTVD